MPLTGPTMTPTVVVPPFNETVAKTLRLRPMAEATRYGYALELLTEAAVTVKVKAATARPFLGGSFVVTGNAATLSKVPSMLAASGAFAVTGTTAATFRTLLLTAAPGGFVVTGIDATLRSSVYSLTANPGSFTATGVSAGTRVARQASAGAGVVTVTGNSANLIPPGSSGLWLFPLDPLFLFDTF
jgi:hypothetical protein